MNPLRFNKRVILSIQHKSDIQNLNKFRTCLRIIFTTFVKKHGQTTNNPSISYYTIKDNTINNKKTMNHIYNISMMQLIHEITPIIFINKTNYGNKQYL